MKIEARQRIVYFAPTAKRHFMTKRAAIKREAAAIIMRKYPTEPMEYDNLGCTDRGFIWSQDARLVRLNRRLIKILTAKALQ